MTPENFCYWLQGMIESRSDQDVQLTMRETRTVIDHLKLVFEKVTPSSDRPVSQSELKVALENQRRILNPNKRYC